MTSPGAVSSTGGGCSGVCTHDEDREGTVTAGGRSCGSVSRRRRTLDVAAMGLPVGQEAEARRLLEQVKVRARGLPRLRPSELTVAGYFERWIEERRAEGIRSVDNEATRLSSTCSRCSARGSPRSSRATCGSSGQPKYWGRGRAGTAARGPSATCRTR